MCDGSAVDLMVAGRLINFQNELSNGVALSLLLIGFEWLLAFSEILRIDRLDCPLLHHVREHVRRWHLAVVIVHCRVVRSLWPPMGRLGLVEGG